MKKKSLLTFMLAVVMMFATVSVASAYTYDSYEITGQGTLTVTGSYNNSPYPPDPYFDKIILQKWNGSNYVTIREMPGVSYQGSFTLSFSGLSQGHYKLLIPNEFPNYYSNIQLSFS